MSKSPGKEPSVVLNEVTVEYALWTFVHAVDRVFPKKAIIDGRAFVADLNAKKPSALEQVFDYSDEDLSLRKSMAACATLEDMQTAFKQASPGSQRLLMLRLASFLERLQALPRDGRLLFPEEPIDMLRYFLVGDWEERLVKCPRPPVSGDQCNKPAPRRGKATHR